VSFRGEDICAPCLLALMRDSSYIYVRSSAERTRLFYPRGITALSELMLVFKLDGFEDGQLVIDNRDVGLYAVTTYNGTAYCETHLYDLSHGNSPNIPQQRTLPWNR
jgi:hypothetical protein